MRFRQILLFASHVLFEHSEISVPTAFPVMNNNGLVINFPEILTEILHFASHALFSGIFYGIFSWNIRLEQVSFFIN